MKRLFVGIAIASFVAGCGGVRSSTPVVQQQSHGLAPAAPSGLKVPVARTFARPVLPEALRALKVGALTDRDRSELDARRAHLGSQRSPQNRSAGFFANEVLVGPDANGFQTYWMAKFGYYTYGSKTAGQIPFPGFLFKYNFAWLYDLGPTNAQASDAYFYDFGAPDGEVGVFYTASTYPSDAGTLYLYDFLLNHFLGYQENSSGPRWFYDFTDAKWLMGNAPATDTIAGASGLARPDNHRTLYYLDAENAATQVCTGGCLGIWPQFVPIPNSSANADVALINRSDGAGMQWTYHGHPLYTYAGDSGADQANGDNLADFGGHWHVARDATSSGPTPTPTPDPTYTPCRDYYSC